jgi:UDP-2,4-diacetamido-2,4,6-trideoxy-beta-L-altropyranose hydrolase
MHIVFRTDASSQIGTGHVVRCLTLADALREQDAKCQFVCRDHEMHLIDYIQFRGYAAHALPRSQVGASFKSDLTHAHWLGTDWKTDAAQTRQALGSEVLDWLIVDHYALDYRWESALRSSCKYVMVIDDLADRQHDCDFLLDQNYGSSAYRYRDLVPPDCTQFNGPEYALLKPAYAKRSAQQPARDGQVCRVLVYFGGGTDAANLIRLAAQTFKAPNLAHIELDIVVGMSYANQSLLEELVAPRGNATIHRELPDLADLMAKADLAIGAGGATTWERCCLGLPSIVISIADNQRPASEALAADGLIEYLGHSDVITPEMIHEKITELLGKPERLRELSEKGMKLVDGNGINRVVDQIILAS